MRFHSSDEVVACERHPLFAEDSCLGCERDLKEFETEGVPSATGRMIGKFIARKSEWKKKLEAVEAFAGRTGLIAFLD